MKDYFWYFEQLDARQAERMTDEELLKRTKEGAIFGTGRRQIELLLKLLGEATRKAERPKCVCGEPSQIFTPDMDRCTKCNRMWYV